MPVGRKDRGKQRPRQLGSQDKVKAKLLPEQDLVSCISPVLCTPCRQGKRAAWPSSKS